jgi:hypothetical protein
LKGGVIFLSHSFFTAGDNQPINNPYYPSFQGQMNGLRLHCAVLMIYRPVSKPGIMIFCGADTKLCDEDEMWTYF